MLKLFHARSLSVSISQLRVICVLFYFYLNFVFYENIFYYLTMGQLIDPF